MTEMMQMMCGEPLTPDYTRKTGRVFCRRKASMAYEGLDGFPRCHQHRCE